MTPAAHAPSSAQAPDVTVLRLGHRPERDKRITTHVCLVARAFGARRVVIAESDRKLVDGVRSVARRFGGAIEVESGVAWKPFLREFPGTKVHLTMYGVPFAPATAALPKDRPLLVVVGAEKVPREVYDLVDANLAVGNQPHSEVAALAVFLYEFLGARALDRVDWPGAEQVIVPTERGKTVRDRRRA